METFFVEFTVDGSDRNDSVLVNPSEVIAVTQFQLASNFVSLHLSNGDDLAVSGIRAEILNKLGIVVR